MSQILTPDHTTPPHALLTYWYRQDRRAQRHLRRQRTALNHAYRSGRLDWQAWERLRIADRRADFVYRALRLARGW